MPSRKTLLFLTVIVLLSAHASAWGPKTREYFCKETISRVWGKEAYVECFMSTRIEEICSLLDGGYQEECLKLTVMPWNIPDNVFMDNEKYHDYSMCPISGLAAGFLCGDREDAPAKEEAEEWFTKARNLADECKRVYAFCIGANYYSKRFFQPYQIKLENPSCEQYFKSKTDEKIDSIDEWSIRGTCFYDFWEPRAGQSKRVTHSQVLVVNKDKVERIVTGLLAEAEKIATHEGGVGEVKVVTSSSTTSVYITTTSTTSTTTIREVETTTTTRVVETTTSTTTVKPLLEKVVESKKTPREAPAPGGKTGGLVASALIALVFVVVVFVLIYIKLKSESKKKPQPTKEASEPKKKKEKHHTLRDIKGLSRVAEDRLKSAGVSSPQELVEMDVEEISKETGISERRLISWRKTARDMLGE